MDRLLAAWVAHLSIIVTILVFGHGKSLNFNDIDFAGWRRP